MQTTMVEFRQDITKCQERERTLEAVVQGYLANAQEEVNQLRLILETLAPTMTKMS